MLILNYIKAKDGLPEPEGPLSQSLSSRSISAANSKVAKVIGAKYKWVKANIMWLMISFAANDQWPSLSFL